MWNERNSLYASKGVDDRVPAIAARYHNLGLEAKNNTKLGGGAGRGAIATMRLMNVKPKAGSSVFEKRLLQEMGGEKSVGMTSFLLQSVSYQDEEKSMVMQTFGDDCVVYFLGRAPRMMNFSAILLDDQINNWFYKFMRAYDTLLRGTRVAKNFRVVALTLPNANVVGTIMNLSYEQESSTDNTVRFSFSMLVKQYQPLSARVNEMYNDVYGRGSWKSSGKKIVGAELPTLSLKDIQNRITSTVIGDVPSAFSTMIGSGTNAILPISMTGSAYDFGGSVSGSSFTTFYLPYEPTRTLMSAGIGEGSDAAGKSLKAPSTFDKIKKFLSDMGANVKNFLGKIEAGLKSVTKMFQGFAAGIKNFIGKITSQIKAFLDPITKIVSAINGTLASVRNIVTTVQNSVDSLFQPFVDLSQDFNEMKRNFENTIGAVTNLPHTLSDKVANNVRLVKFAGVASLGSLSGGVSSPEAMSVLALLKPRSSEELGILGSNTTVRNETGAVLAL